MGRTDKWDFLQRSDVQKKNRKKYIQKNWGIGFFKQLIYRESFWKMYGSEE